MEEKTANTIVNAIVVYLFVIGAMLWLVGSVYFLGIRTGGFERWSSQNVIFFIVGYAFGLILAAIPLLSALWLKRRQMSGRYITIALSTAIAIFLLWFTAFSTINDSFRMMRWILIIPAALSIISIAVVIFLFNKDVKALFDKPEVK